MPAYPPFKVRMSGSISLTCWFLVIIFGRFIAYDWFYCEKTPEGSLMYTLEECAVKLDYLNDITEEPAAEEPVAEEPAPADGETPPAAAPAEGAAPAAPAAAPATPPPATPAPGLLQGKGG